MSRHLRPQLYVWAVTAALAGAAALFRPADSPLHTPLHIPWVVISGAFVLADVAMVQLDFRDQNHCLNLQAMPLALGLVFCGPEGLMLARVLATVVAMGFKFRQPPMKLCFNIAQQALRITVAEWVAYTLLAHHSPVSAWGWLALLAAGAAGDVIASASIVTVIWITAGRPPASMLKELVVAEPAVLVTAITLGLICISVLWVNPWAAWTIIVVAGVATVVHQLYHRLSKRYKNLERLYDFTGSVGALRSSAELIHEILTRARSTLRAQRASLLIQGGTAFARTTVTEDGSEVEHDVEPGALEARVLSEAAAVLAPRTANASHSAELARDGLRDAMAVPVGGDHGVVGVLLVSHRLGDLSTFDRADLMLFEALAGAASVALRRGQLVEELKEEMTAKQHQALHDSLTGLPNRTYFTDRLNEVLAGDKRRTTRRVGVLLMDLDEFKEINDTLGHDVGDAVLIQAGQRLREAVGDGGVVTRLGGDEFALLVTEEPADGFVGLARRAVDAVEAPMDVEDMTLRIRASVGVTMYPDHGTDTSTLLRRADVAMYAAKGQQLGIVEYSAEKDHHSTRRLGLVGDLRRALESEGLELYYQPKADLRDGSIVGVEALLRWNHPSHGMVPPDEFIPMAEQAGLMGPLTEWVLGHAIEQQARWGAGGLDLPVALNISVRNLLNPGLPADVARHLSRCTVRPADVTLEITETSVMADPTRCMAVLAELDALGVRLSLDDFGTGYSSLSRLARMPVDEVKIDKSLVSNMLSDTGDLAIVRATIDVAQYLNLVVVAEGIEDMDTWQRLVELGCHRAQGYYLSRPLTVPALEAWLARREHMAAEAAELANVVSLRPLVSNQSEDDAANQHRLARPAAVGRGEIK